MKIVFIIHSLSGGGMERVMSLLLNEFSTNKNYINANLHLILIGRTRSISNRIPSTITAHQPSWNFNNKFRFFYILKTILFLRHKLREIGPYSILSFGERWNNLVLLSSIGLGINVFISDRASPNKKLGLLHNSLRNILYPIAKGIIAQTEQSAAEIQRQSWNFNVKIIGNPIVNYGPPSYPRQTTIISVGRLIKSKNFDKLIEIFSQMDLESNWKLLIIGGNAANNNLLEQYKLIVNNSCKPNQIFLLGQLGDVYRYLSEASIFAFTSSSEGFPNALAEAMSAGCACISYDCNAGPSDLIDDGINGFLIPLNNESLFKSKLELLIRDAELCVNFGKAASKKMRQFDVEVISKRYFNFITS